MNTKRFNDFGTLKYVLRGINSHMPYIENVYLIVSSLSQVPDYVDTNKVKVVLHEDIIPDKCLPTFNSNVIETYMWKIEGLSEQFVYLNDDMIPTGYIPDTMLFENGLPCYMANSYSISYDIENNCSFYGILKTCNNLARIATGDKGLMGTTSLFYTQHTLTPFLKSDCESCYKKIERYLLPILTRIRAYNNPSQFLYSCYSYYLGKYVAKNIKYGFVSIGNTRFTINDICSEIENKNNTSVCINDHSVTLSDDEVSMYVSMVINSLENVLPNKSIYEK